jgi:hypothetical protein
MFLLYTHNDAKKIFVIVTQKECNKKLVAETQAQYLGKNMCSKDVYSADCLKKGAAGRFSE